MALKDKAYYQAIADQLVLPSQAFIDGSFAPAASGAVIRSINPATGETLGTVSHCQPEDVDRAVKAARRVFGAGTWSRCAPEERKAVLLKLANLIRENSDELAVMESIDSGKPIKDCIHEISTEVPNTFQWYAELIDKSFGKIAPTDASACAMIIKEPIGVAGLVLPWNFPLLMAAWKLAPALASGCSAIVKPAEQTSYTALRLAELAAEAGIPAGVLNILPGLGETTGQAIGRHHGIDVVSFTGSTEVGRYFLKYSSESNLKPIGLEMGGKSPFIILGDTKITDDLIDNAVSSAFWNGGQNCSANMRQIVDKKIVEEFTHRVVEKTKKIAVGNPLDPLTELGPMVTLEHRNTVMRYVEAGRTGGADIALDMADAYTSTSDCFVGPSVFTNMTPEMKIAREEIFGPVLGILTVDGMEEALACANNSDYGLHATVFTQDIDKALYMARRLACGTVGINGFTEGDIKTPFGGYKQSGSLARDKGTEAMDQYLQSKTIWINVNQG
ncbi:aldehyde dehydrogenase [Kordiimonas pumila]|uniref:Aldehyde dehydrogenase n=1 Tax=Kordiimonas pumila TaxID=2161677 RepID=A0ABV7D540_9PROT|nr:aldehyde dehydrogenase [Kordiimonas pumila]